MNMKLIIKLLFLVLFPYCIIMYYDNTAAVFFGLLCYISWIIYTIHDTVNYE